MKNRTKRFLKSVVLVSLAVSSMTFLGGCGKSESDGFRVVVIGKKQSEISSYWSIIRKGAEDASKELGVNVVYDAPKDAANLEQQIKLVEQYTDEGISAIVIAPIDKDALNDAFDAADKKGIPILAIDSDTTSGAKKTCISTNNRSGGEVAANAAIDLIGDSGTVAVISDIETAENTSNRMEGFKNAIESHKGITVCDVKYCESDREKAKDMALELMDSTPDLKLMFGTNETATLGICDAVEEKGKGDEVSVIGFDCSDDVQKYMKKDIIDGTIVQNPYNMGYLGVRNAQKICKEDFVPSEIDTGVTLVNKDNMNDKDIKFLINPLGN